MTGDVLWRPLTWTGDGGPGASLLSALALQREVGELARLVAAALSERTGCRRASLLLPRQGSPILVDRAGGGAWLDVADAPAAVALSLHTGQAAVVGDLSGVPGAPTGSGAALVTPLMLGEEGVGLLAAWSDSPALEVPGEVRVWTEALAAAATLALSALWGGADAVLAGCLTRPAPAEASRALASPELLAAELRRLRSGDAIAVVALGDDATRPMAAILSGLVRESDVAAQTAPDTVVLLLRHCSEAGAELVLDRFRRALGDAPVRWGVAVAEEGDLGQDLLNRVRAGLSVSGPSSGTRAADTPPG